MARKKDAAAAKGLPVVSETVLALEVLQAGRAPYNPRRISAHDAAQLEASIREFGLVEPLVWNVRTNRLVGGHQRLDALAKIGAKEASVRLVDLDEPREKALNLKLNRVHGEWDWDKLAALIEELGEASTELPLETGFTHAELEALDRDGDLLELELETLKGELGRGGAPEPAPAAAAGAPEVVSTAPRARCPVCNHPIGEALAKALAAGKAGPAPERRR